MKVPTVYLIAGGVVAAALIYVATRPKGWATDTGVAAGQGAYDLVDGFVGGVFTGVTNFGGLGLPRTDMTKCQADLAAGRTWDASFSCPAGTFIKSFF